MRARVPLRRLPRHDNPQGLPSSANGELHHTPECLAPESGRLARFVKNRQKAVTALSGSHGHAAACPDHRATGVAFPMGGASWIVWTTVQFTVRAAVTFMRCPAPIIRS